MKLTAHLRWLAPLLVAASCSSPDPVPSYAPLTPSGTGTTGGVTSGTTGTATTGVSPQATSAVQSSNASAITGSAQAAASTTGFAATGAGTTGDVGSPTNGGFQNASTTGTPTTTTTTTTSAGAGGMSATATTGSMEGCESGPLDAPLPNCEPVPVPDTGDYYADCVARINQFRWECQCLPPLERWTEAEDCADQQAEYDYQQNSPHAGIRDGICSPGGGAQNECPGYGPNFGIVDFCLQQMWDEGPGEDFQAHGHYLNMSNTRFSRVACGWYETPNGEIWAVQNFD